MAKSKKEINNPSITNKSKTKPVRNAAKKELDKELIKKAKKIKLPDTDPASCVYRRRLIAQQLIYGYSPAQIKFRYATEWNLTHHTLAHYITDARKIIAQEIQTDAEEIKIELVAKYNMLFLKAMEGENYKEARAVLDSLTKLTQSIKHDVQTNATGPIQTINLVEMIRDLNDAESDKFADEQGYETINPIIDDSTQ